MESRPTRVPFVLDGSVFKAYDVRGVYPDELDEEGAYAIGRAYVEHFEPRRIAVGRDMRLSSPTMAAAVVDGARDGGADVLDIGLVGTEVLYFAVGDLELDGGICVTASHNPKEYTGMKIVRRGALPVGGDSGLGEVRARAAEGFGAVEERGEVTSEDVWPAFVEKALSFVDHGAISALRVVIDGANGMAGVILPPVLDRLPQLDVVRCYFEPDGKLPEPRPQPPASRESEVHRRANPRGAGRPRCRVRRRRRSLLFVDDTGEFVPGDFVTALLAEAVLEKEPGGTVIYDVRASWAVPETIERSGGTGLVNRVGHAFIKQRMREERATFAGEVSAHHYFRDFFQADSAWSRSCSCSSSCRGAAASCRSSSRPIASASSSPGDQHARRRRGAEDPGAEGALQRARWAHIAPRRNLDRLRRVALQRPPVEHEPLLRLNLEALSRGLMEESETRCSA